MALRFGVRSVPALKLDGGEKVSGSRNIMRTLDELVPDPPLLPRGRPAARAAVLDAERWGDEVLQPLVRRIVWGALRRRPGAIPSYQAASQLPRLPRPVVKVVAPAVIAIARPARRRRRRRARGPARAARPPRPRRRLDRRRRARRRREQPNAADLQIGSSLRLLSTIGDVRPLLAGRPAEQLASGSSQTSPARSRRGLPAGLDRAA